jgi:hypothetical protein
MGALLDAYVDAKARRQGLLEPHSNPKTDNSGQRAMGDGRSDFDKDRAD